MDLFRRFARAISARRRKSSQATRKFNNKPSVLFVTSNGAGIGHLTRVLAVIEKLKIIDYQVLTMSTGVSRLNFESTRVHYFPSHANLGLDAAVWNHALSKQLESLLIVYKPQLVVFDGTFVYSALTRITRKLRIPLWWIQRGCWKTEVDQASSQRHSASSVCDGVIIPGDYAISELVDVGPNVKQTSVSPIILESHSQEIPKNQLFEALQLQPDKKYALVQLGAGNINDIEKSLFDAVDSILQIDKDWEVVVLRNPLSLKKFNLIQNNPRVHFRKVYPISQYYSVFRFAVFAAGYNSVQESISHRLPTVFIPNALTKTDDQLKRALGVEKKGLGYCAIDEESLRVKIRKIAQIETNDQIKSKMKAVIPASGAMEVASLIENFVTDKLS